MATDNQSDSQETNSTLSVDDSLNITFKDVCYKVRNGFLAGGSKTILQNVSGHFNSGDLSVIIGQSGAGKSTLMDILAGYTKPTSGRVCVNGLTRNERLFRRRSCYILQDDQIHDTLTVQESLFIAAELKLGNHVSKQQKDKRVEELITSLGVSTARNTRAGSLSGGQKKRLAIGLELVSDPTVLFLDEPTRTMSGIFKITDDAERHTFSGHQIGCYFFQFGLDSSISKQLIYLLHLLARQGRTVVITMHQPSALLLHMVDRLYAVVGGRCAYMGSVSLLLPYLSQMNLICPPYHNPVDFFIEICLGNEDKLVELSENGSSKKWIQNSCKETDKLFIEYKSGNEDVFLTTIRSTKENPTNKILLALKTSYPSSSWNQFLILTRRSLLGSWRNPSFCMMITAIHAAMALFVGFLFYDVGEDAKYVRDNYNFLYFSLMFLMFTAFSGVSVSFPEQIPVIRREHFNRWYTSGAYYASTLVSTLPIQTVCTLTFGTITFFLTGQPLEVIRFTIFIITLLLVSYVSLCIGLFNGSLFNVKNGIVFGSFFIMPFTVFSGFFLRYSDAPHFIQWFFQLSFLKHGLSGLVISIFGLNRPKLICTDLYCHYTYPAKFLEDNGMTDERYSIVVVSLIAIGSVFICFAYITLKIRLKSKW